MTKVAVSGGTGYVGRFVVDHFLSRGHEVIVLGRQAPPTSMFRKHVKYCSYSLSDTDLDPTALKGCEVLVHAAFHHVEGKYRGGEGDDAEGFRTKNQHGSMALFKAAKKAGIKRTIFISSRAAYGTMDPGLALTEEMKPQPDTLYGKIKYETERGLMALEADGFLPLIIRSTGVYGTSAGSTQHKWLSLFDAFEKSEAIAPRIGTEVHGVDFADAVALLMNIEQHLLADMRVFNVSDILLDRRDLLKSYAEIHGLTGLTLPARSDQDTFNHMDCSRLMRLGWKPRGVLDLSFMADT